MALACCGLQENTSPESRPTQPPVASAPESRSLRPSVDVFISPLAGQFRQWAENRSLELSIELGIPEPAAISIIYAIPEVTGVSESGKEVTYIGGRYYLDSFTIAVWVLDPFGREETLEELKHLFYHEYLHHYDLIHGLSCPEDHNAIFDERIRSYGWK